VLGTVSAAMWIRHSRSTRRIADEGGNSPLREVLITADVSALAGLATFTRLGVAAAC